MADQIRSADLVLKNALASPQIMSDLKTNTEQTLKTLVKDTVEMLPRAMGDPNPLTTNAIWIIVVCSFSVVMLYSAYVLGSGVATALVKEGIYVTRGETVLTLFTTVVAFLAGLLAPSPLKKQQSKN